MPHTTDNCYIDEVLVVVADGNDSQTVNVCASGNILGHYRQTYRCRHQNCWVTTLMLQSNASTLAELETYLLKRSFEITGGRGHS